VEEMEVVKEVVLVGEIGEVEEELLVKVLEGVGEEAANVGWRFSRGRLWRY